MEIPKDFEELYEKAENHDIVGFNRELYWTLRLMDDRHLREVIAEDIYNDFLNSEHCLECVNVQPTTVDMMVVDDGFQKILTKVCHDCGVETEIES